MEKAQIYRNQQHKRYLDIRELIGPDFDSEAFDLARTNAIEAIGWKGHRQQDIHT
jgi:hypothetical protein